MKAPISDALSEDYERLKRRVDFLEDLLRGHHSTHAYKDPRSMADSFADCKDWVCVKFLRGDIAAH